MGSYLVPPSTLTLVDEVSHGVPTPLNWETGSTLPPNLPQIGAGRMLLPPIPTQPTTPYFNLSRNPAGIGGGWDGGSGLGAGAGTGCLAGLAGSIVQTVFPFNLRLVTLPLACSAPESRRRAKYVPVALFQLSWHWRLDFFQLHEDRGGISPRHSRIEPLNRSRRREALTSPILNGASRRRLRGSGGGRSPI